MRKPKTVALVAALSIIAILAACSSSGTESARAEATIVESNATTTVDATAATTTTAVADAGDRRDGGPGGADPSSVTTISALDSLIQSAYGDAGLGLHRGHQPVQDVLDTVLGITHDELHVRLDAGQNLAEVAEELEITPQTLIDALVESWSVGVDNVLASGEVTQDQAADYLEALEVAFAFRVNWNGSDATPTFSGIV